MKPWIVTSDGTDRFIICPRCQAEMEIDWEDTEDGDMVPCDECNGYLKLEITQDDGD